MLQNITRLNDIFENHTLLLIWIVNCLSSFQFSLYKVETFLSIHPAVSEWDLVISGVACKSSQGPLSHFRILAELLHHFLDPRSAACFVERF